MSWSKTWTATLARAIDIFFATITFNRYDLTLSTLAYCARRMLLPGVGQAFLRDLYDILDWLEPGHCEGAYTADMLRLQGAEGFLKSIPSPSAPKP